MQGIFLNCSPPSALFRTGFYGVLPHFFRFFRHFWSQGGSCYQNSVKACLTIQVWSQRFWSVEISDVSSPFSNVGKKSEMDIFMKMPRHLVIELDSAEFWEKHQSKNFSRCISDAHTLRMTCCLLIILIKFFCKQNNYKSLSTLILFHVSW